MVTEIKTFKNQINDDAKELWKEIFADSDEYISYFEKNFTPHYTLYCTYEEKNLLSMFFFIDTSLIYAGKRYKTLYLYAAATKKKYRGKGLFSKMFEEAVKEYPGYDFVICVPAGQYLYNFYQNKGFESIFERRLFTLPISFYKEKFNVSKFDGNYERLYDIYLKNRNNDFCIDRDYEFFKKSIIAGNFEIFYTDSGYMLVANEKVYDICEKENCNNTSIPFIFCKNLKADSLNVSDKVYESIMLD